MPCLNHLWGVNDEAELLDDVKDDLLHLITVKLIYITNGTRIYIEPAVAFFTTAVTKSYVENWKKLRRCISYLNQTVDDVRIVGGFNLTEFFTWVYVSYDAHPNMRSQIGVVISIGHGMLHCRYSKKNLNAKGLTEAELIGTSEYVTFNV